MVGSRDRNYARKFPQITFLGGETRVASAAAIKCLSGVSVRLSVKQLGGVHNTTDRVAEPRID